MPVGVAVIAGRATLRLLSRCGGYELRGDVGVHTSLPRRRTGSA